jgi:hypothetical protein
MPAKPITAALVRETLRSNEAKFSTLSPAAQHTLREGARGKVHPDAIALFNKGRKADRRYAVGASKAVSAQAKESAQALRESAAKAGFEVGARGPLPQAAKVALGLSKG